MIPSGLRKGETEFLEFESNIIAIHEGNKMEIKDLPLNTLRVIDMAISKSDRTCMNQMGVTGFFEQIIQFLKCNASVYDGTPDLKDGEFQNEYCQCNFRHKCQHQGKLCKVVKLANGKHLTFSQMRITSHIRAGLFDKEIAQACGIALNTVKAQKQQIQDKLEVERKAMIAVEAINIGIA